MDKTQRSALLLAVGLPGPVGPWRWTSVPFQHHCPSFLWLRALLFVAKVEKKLSCWKTERMETMLWEEKLQGLLWGFVPPFAPCEGSGSVLGGPGGLRAAGMAA